MLILLGEVSTRLPVSTEHPARLEPYDPPIFDNFDSECKPSSTHFQIQSNSDHKNFIAKIYQLRAIYHEDIPITMVRGLNPLPYKLPPFLSEDPQARRLFSLPPEIPAYGEALWKEAKYRRILSIQGLLAVEGNHV